MTLEIGTPAPEFTLKDQHGQDVSLTDFRGEKNVVIVFYPFAFSRVCTGELCELRDNITDFSDDHTALLAVSCDHMFSQRAFAEHDGITFPLLSDFWPHGAVAQAYGVFNDKAGMAVRGTFLIDKQGVIRFAEANQPGEARDQDAWKRALKAL